MSRMKRGELFQEMEHLPVPVTPAKELLYGAVFFRLKSCW